MQYGTFDELHREYVITDPRTPVKWINYIGTRAFGGFIDHTGGALICKDDPTFNRITKYIQQLPASDFKGETFYLRLHRPDGYLIFSPFYVPTLHPLERFECRVGLGYSRWIAEFAGLRADLTVFVPIDGACELRDLRLTNLASTPQIVDAIPGVEYTPPDALKQFTNADWIPQTMQSRAIQDGAYTILIQYPFMFRDTRVNYLTSNLPAASFESDRKRFLGDNEYGTFRLPLGLLDEQLSNTQAERGDLIGALLHPLRVLQPGETRRLIIQLGQADPRSMDKAMISRFRDPAEVDESFARLHAFWDEYLAAFQAHTPDPRMNLMVNIFNPYQCYVTKTWSRYLSYYQLGLGTRGIGIRDSSQDLLAVMATEPEEARQFLITLLSFQKRDGSAVHQFNPLTLQGSQGDAMEMDDRPHYYSDDHLWILLAVAAYLKETGDFKFLDIEVPFYEKKADGDPLEVATAIEHIQRGIHFTQDDLGSHGLPKLGFADWNDTINLPAGAESLFTANLYGKTLLEVIALSDCLGDSKQAGEYRVAYEEMRTRVESCAWDGEWYLRYFDAEGAPIGSAGNTYGQIYLNGQSWPVISGFASPERARMAMDAVYHQLNTRYGIKLSSPGFNGYDPHYGGVTTYPPGAKENGGIFLHPNPWAMIAETILGNGDRAYEYYTQINPAGHNEHIERYECEPYVYAQNILGNEHPQFGLGRNSWLSGTASWCYQAATQWILGVRPEYDGLRIDPAIPSAWPGFSMTRRFRGAVFHIQVHNPQHVSKGVARIELNGWEVTGALIPPCQPGKGYSVEVWLGR